MGGGLLLDQKWDQKWDQNGPQNGPLRGRPDERKPNEFKWFWPKIGPPGAHFGPNFGPKTGPILGATFSEMPLEPAGWIENPMGGGLIWGGLFCILVIPDPRNVAFC